MCWFHDAGLVFFNDAESPNQVRNEHRIRCREFLLIYLSEHLSELERDIISDISMTHLEADVTRLHQEYWVECGVRSPMRVRPRLIASLLRVCDAAEMTQSRVSWRVRGTFQ